MSDNNSEIMRAIGRIEGKIDGIIEKSVVVDSRLNSHADKINNLERVHENIKGKVSVVSFVAGITGSALVIWIKTKFGQN